MDKSCGNDQVLWQQFKSGSTLAFSSIFDRHLGGLMHYGKLFTTDEALIEDSIQDVFVTIWEKRSNLGEVISIKHYLCSALRRRLLRKLQAQRRMQGSQDLLNSPAMPVEASYETWLLRQQSDDEVKRTLQHLITQLTSQQKRVIYLKFYEHLSYEEIATLLKLNKRTVYNTCSAAIKHLQQHVSRTPVLRTLLSSAVSWLAGVMILIG